MQSTNNIKNSNNTEKPPIFGHFLLSRGIINPKRDWTTIMIVATILFLSALAFDGIMYQKISSGEMYVSVSESELNVDVLKKEELTGLINEYELKKGRIQSTKAKSLIDPSI